MRGHLFIVVVERNPLSREVDGSPADLPTNIT